MAASSIVGTISAAGRCVYTPVFTSVGTISVMEKTVSMITSLAMRTMSTEEAWGASMGLSSRVGTMSIENGASFFRLARDSIMMSRLPMASSYLTSKTEGLPLTTFFTLLFSAPFFLRGLEAKWLCGRGASWS